MGDPGDRGAYRFGPFQLDVRERRLSRGTDVIPLRLKVFDTLCVLVENAGRLVTKQELLATVWPDTTVEENNLNHNISVLRKALGEKATGQQYIETVPRVGYRFVAAVETAEPEPTADGVSARAGRVIVRRQRLPTDDRASPARAALGERSVSCSPSPSSWPSRPRSALYLARSRTSGRTAALTDKDSVLIADFANTTGDDVFDGTLRQAVAVELGQSPFLNVVSEERVRETLRYIGRSPDERVTRDLAREIAQRQGVKALLLGSIASLGRHYVINLEAVSAASGETIAREQAEAESRERILVRLGEAATRLREKLGESLASIEKFSAPIEQATTASLDAFKAYDLGRQRQFGGQYFEAIPLYRRAVELDPDFAMAYAALGITYGTARESRPRRAVLTTSVRASRSGERAREVLHLGALLHGRARRRRSSHRGAGAVEADLSSRLRAPHEPGRALRRDRTLPGGSRRSARGRPPEPGRRCRVHSRRAHVDRSRPIGGGGGGHRAGIGAEARPTLQPLHALRDCSPAGRCGGHAATDRPRLGNPGRGAGCWRCSRSPRLTPAGCARRGS